MVQNVWWGQVGKLNESEMSQGNAQLKNEWGNLSKTAGKPNNWRKGNRLTNLIIDNTLYDAINEEVEKYSIQAGEEAHWSIDPLSWREVNYAIKQLRKANIAFDTNKVHPMMLKKLGTTFRELMVQLLKNCL